MTCWLSNGHGFDRRVGGPPWSDASGWNEADFSTIRLADVDGDGRADLCARGAAGFTCHRSTGKDFIPWPTLAALSDAAGFADPSRYATMRMGDVDGDGRADLCARFPEGMACFRAGEHAFDERLVGPAWSDASGFAAWQRWSTIRLADVDGDGRADLCALENEGFRCALSDGRGFGAKVMGPALAVGGEGSAHRERPGSLRMADLDGDGRADLCARGPLAPGGSDADPQGLTCFLWSGHGFDRAVTPIPLPDEAGWASPHRYRTLRLADVNGDGQSDLCGRGAEGLTCWLFDQARYPILDAPAPAWMSRGQLDGRPPHERLDPPRRARPCAPHHTPWPKPPPAPWVIRQERVAAPLCPPPRRAGPRSSPCCSSPCSAVAVPPPRIDVLDAPPRSPLRLLCRARAPAPRRRRLQILRRAHHRGQRGWPARPTRRRRTILQGAFADRL